MFMYLFFLIWRAVRMKERWEELKDLQVQWSKALQQPGVRQAEARSWKLQPGIPCKQQVFYNFSKPLLPLRVCISKKLEREEEPRLDFRHCGRGFRQSKWHIYCCIKHLSFFLNNDYFFKKKRGGEGFTHPFRDKCSSHMSSPKFLSLCKFCDIWRMSIMLIKECCFKYGIQ